MELIGTCVRDYVHVLDVVSGIVKSINQPSNEEFNCIASGRSYSVAEVINTMKKVSKVNFKVIKGPRRPGDAAIITIPSHLKNYIEPTHSLDEMCFSAFKMELNSL